MPVGSSCTDFSDHVTLEGNLLAFLLHLFLPDLIENGIGPVRIKLSMSPGDHLPNRQVFRRVEFAFVLIKSTLHEELELHVMFGQRDVCHVHRKQESKDYPDVTHDAADDKDCSRTNMPESHSCNQGSRLAGECRDTMA